MLNGDIDLQSTDALNDYMDREELPKFMFYSTHQECLDPLLGAFNNMPLIDPAPASSMFFWFFSYTPEGASESILAVNVTYAVVPGDRSTH